MGVHEEIVSLLWPWIVYMEEDPHDWRSLTSLETQHLQQLLIQVVDMLQLGSTPVQES